MATRPTVNVLVLSAALLMGAGCYILRAAPASQSGVANVDMQRVLAESDARKKADEQVKQTGSQLYQRFNDTAAMQYLTPEEIGEFSELLNAATPTDAQKARIEAIKAENTKRSEEATKLATRKDADLTAADRTRLRELSGMPQNRMPALDHVKQIYQDMVNQEDEKQMRAAQAEVRAAIGKLAKEQGVSEVFDSTAMVCAPLDLTDQAIQRVKKK